VERSTSRTHHFALGQCASQCFDYNGCASVTDSVAENSVNDSSLCGDFHLDLLSNVCGYIRKRPLRDTLHLSLPAHDNYFHHLISISVFHPHGNGRTLLNGCYFVFARVFANDIDIGDNGQMASLIFVLESVRLCYRQSQTTTNISHP